MTLTITVPAEGSLDSQIAFVGEAGGREEEILGRPFVGSSGELLTRLIHRQGILRSCCYITNVIKLKPNKNDITPFIDLSKRQIPRSQAYYEYEQLLKDELSKCKANVIVAVGAVALWALCNKQGIMKWRGSILSSTLLPGRKVIPIIHPAAALREYMLQYRISLDLRRVKEESSHAAIYLPRRDILINPTYDQALGFLHDCLKATIIACDIETFGTFISHISFAPHSNKAISIPFIQGGQRFYTPQHEAHIWRSIALILENHNILKVFQNAMFDLSVLYRVYGIVIAPVEDTMIAQAVAMPEMPKGLDFITSAYTREPYYKDEGKSWSRLTETNDAFSIYNAKDSAVLLEALPRIKKEIVELDNGDYYRSKLSLIHPLLFMQARGIRIDKLGLVEESKNLDLEISQLKAELAKLTGVTDEKFANSSKQLQTYFYVKKGIRPYVSATTGSVTVDKTALTRIAAKGFREAKVILNIRRAVKLKSTYMDVELDKDGRLRCSFNPVGTKWGRVSSSQTLFGTGTNMQNLPPQFKKYMFADEGYIGFDVDLDKAENRIVAYIAPDSNMIKAFEEGIDLHCLTAGLIFGKHWKEVSDEDGSCSIGGGAYSERFWGKKANHAFNYGFGYRKFALLYEIAEREAKFIREGYYRAYPGVTKYHEWIQERLRESRRLTNCLGESSKFLDRWGDDLFKEAYAFIPQSTVAGIINRALRLFYEDQKTFGPVELLNQVHDSLVFQIPLNIGFIAMSSILLQMKMLLEEPVHWEGRSIRIPAGLKAGKSFGITKKVDWSKNQTEAALAAHLAEVWSQL